MHRVHRVHGAPRRGAVIVQVVLVIALLLSFAALAVDVGLMYSIRADLQSAADSAALAGASGYFTDQGLIQDPAVLEAVVKARAQEFAALNESFRAGPTVVDVTDITLGYFDRDNPDTPLDTSGDVPFNAVQVTARRAPGSSNGGVLFYFARVFGFNEGSVSASATAMIDDQFSGFHVEESNGPNLLPLTMYIEAYDYLVENGVDDYAWDADAEAVEEEADSVNEVRVFPWKESGNGDGDAGEEPTDGAGNFGIIDFGGGNASVVQEQITNGIAPADMVDAIGTSDPVYFDEDGNPVTYDIPGQPGMMSSIESALASRIGDVIAFFVHDQVADPGSNAVYHNVGIRYGRLMAVQLTGNPNTRKVAVQPVAYQGSAVSVSESAPSTSGQLGRITLVR